ncbi:hypothetical protein V6N13_135848 [Hibiscus sabdariffa]
MLAFPCLIFGLCHREAFPTRPNDKYTQFRTGWDRKHYMKKMDIDDAIPIKVSMPTPAPSELAQPSAHATDPEDPAGTQPDTHSARCHQSPSAASTTKGSFFAAASPLAPSAAHQPSPARSNEAPPLYFL